MTVAKTVQTILNRFKDSFQYSKYNKTKRGCLSVGSFEKEECLTMAEIYFPNQPEMVTLGVAHKTATNETAIGIRNKYGNGFREIPLKVLLNLFWGEDVTDDKRAFNNVKVMRTGETGLHVLEISEMRRLLVNLESVVENLIELTKHLEDEDTLTVPIEQIDELQNAIGIDLLCVIIRLSFRSNLPVGEKVYNYIVQVDEMLNLQGIVGTEVWNDFKNIYKNS